MNIQHHYDQLEMAKKALANANALGREHQRRAMRILNRKRAALKHAQNGTTSATRYNPHFETRVQGLPCWISVTYYEPPEPSTFNFAGSPAYAEYYIVNESGYRMRFMEEKLNKHDERRILTAIEENAGKCLD